MPSRLAKEFAHLVSIEILKPPVALKSYDIKIYWHERFDRAPASRWFRRALVQLFRE